MLRNRLFYAVFLAACLAFSMLYTSKISAILLITVALYPFVAAGLTALQLAFLKADFALDRVTVDKNTTFEFGLSVKNGSVLPCAPLELVCLLPDTDSGRFVRKRIYVSLSPLASARLVVEGRHLYRGCYTSALESISAIDPLRIVRISKKLRKQMTMVFLPRKLTLDDVISSAAGEQSYSRPNSITSEKEDFSHVRDYRSGDNIQLVHWKLTAKQGGLMIKQYDSADDKRMLVICDWSDGAGGDSFLRVDTTIETALAFVKAALDGGINSTVLMGEPADYEAASITNAADFDRFYEMMSVLPVAVDSRPEDFFSLVDSADMSAAAAVVLITANLTEEVIFRAEEYAKSGDVYLVYVNLGDKPVENSLYEQQFLFFNLRGSGEEALKLAAALSKPVE